VALRPRSGQLVQPDDPAVLDAVQGGEAGEVEPERRSEHGLELFAGDLRCLGQELEDATAVVVEADDADGGLGVAQESEAVRVVMERQIPDHHPCGAP
jgi:hypothetical protein